MPAPKVRIGGNPSRVIRSGRDCRRLRDRGWPQRYSRRRSCQRERRHRRVSTSSVTTRNKALEIAGVAHGLVDGGHRQAGLVPQQLPLIRVIAEDLDGGGDLVACGVGACQQESGDEHAQLFGVESITVVLGTNEVGEQVVGQGVATSGDHVVDVIVEFAPGAHHVGHVVGGEGEC